MFDPDNLDIRIRQLIDQANAAARSLEDALHAKNADAEARARAKLDALEAEVEVVEVEGGHYRVLWSIYPEEPRH